MVKVIQHGNKRRVRCENCGALLEYKKEDTKVIQTVMNEYERSIICPECEESVVVRM